MLVRIGSNGHGFHHSEIAINYIALLDRRLWPCAAGAPLAAVLQGENHQLSAEGGCTSFL